MGFCGRFLLLSMAVLVLGVGMLFNVHIPEGFQDPVPLRIQFGIMEAFKLYERLLTAMYGVRSIVEMNRKFMNSYDPGFNTTGLKIHDTTFDGVGVRIYVPEDGAVSDAAIINIHGGGWVTGGLESIYHRSMIDLAKRMKLTVISIDYRLAPEHLYPVPLEDCIRAVEYFLLHSEDYDVNPGRVALMGDSAGGNLVAAVSLALRDKTFKRKAKLQLLFYPELQAIDFMTPSMQQYATNTICDRNGAPLGLSLYAFGDKEDIVIAMRKNMHTSSAVKQQFSKTILNHKTIPLELIHEGYIEPKIDFGNDTMWQEVKDVFLDPYYAPLMASDLTGLPQAYVLTMEQDVLRDEGIWYAQRLKSAGNRVTHEHYESGFHGLLSLSEYKDCQDAWEQVYRYLEHEL